MRNFVQPGESLAVAVPYAAGVTAGQGVLVGALFGVAAVDGAQNAVIKAATQGVFDLTEEPSLAISAGARVFWDNANRRVTTTAAGNFQVGIATTAALATDATVYVWLTTTMLRRIAQQPALLKHALSVAPCSTMRSRSGVSTAPKGICVFMRLLRRARGSHIDPLRATPLRPRAGHVMSALVLPNWGAP